MTKLNARFAAPGVQLGGHIPVILFFLCLLVRIVGISDLPIYVDESANILASASERYNWSIDPMSLGRPLLSFEFVPPFLLSNFLSSISLLALSRCWVALISSLTIFPLYGVGQRLGSHCGAIACVAWVASPLIWAHDRLALQDPIGSSFIAWTAYLGVIGIDGRVSLRRAAIATFGAGIFFACAELNKITAVISLPWLFGLLCTEQSSPRKFVAGRLTAFALTFVAGAWVPGLFFGAELLHFGTELNRFGHSPFALMGPSSSVSLGEVFREALHTLKYYVQFQYDYNGITFLITLIAVWWYGITYLPKLKSLRLGTIITFMGAFSAYSTIAYARYFHPEFIPLSLMLGASGSDAYDRCRRVAMPRVCSARNDSSNSATRTLMARSILLLLLSTFMQWTLTRASVAVNAYYNDLTYGRGRWVDYAQYTMNFNSGNGLSKLTATLTSLRGSRSRPVTIFCSPENVSGARGLQYQYFKDPNVRVIEAPLYPSGALEVIGHYFRRPRYPDEMFLLLEEGWLEDLNNKTITDDLLSSGIHLKLLDTIPRASPAIYRLFSIEEFLTDEIRLHLKPQHSELGAQGGPRIILEIRPPSIARTIRLEGNFLADNIPARSTLEVFDGPVSLTKIPLKRYFTLNIPISERESPKSLELFSNWWNLVPDPESRQYGYRNLFLARGPVITGIAFENKINGFPGSSRAN